MEQVRPVLRFPLLMAALVAVINTLLYLSMLPERLTSGNYGVDAGDFLTAILTGGIPHPTGYPTFILFGRLFQLFPWGSPLQKGILVSTVSAALASGLAALWAARCWERACGRVCALAAGAAVGLALGTSPLLFSQSVIVDVHGLQILLVVLLGWWAWLNTHAGENNRPSRVVYPLALAAGAAFGNHVTFVLLLPLIAAVFWWLWHIPVRRRSAAWQILLVLCGLGVYLYLPLAARQDPPVNWGDPQTLEGFLWVISGAPYRGLLFGLPADSLWERLRSLPAVLLDQFGLAGLLVGAAGALQFPSPSRKLSWLLLYVFSVFALFSIVYATGDSAPYLLPAILVFSIWIGGGVVRFWTARWRNLPLGQAVLLLAAAAALLRLPETRALVDQRASTSPADFAEQYLRQAPPSAILITTATEDTFPLWYYHFGLGYRPDVRILVLPLTQFRWYQRSFAATYPDLLHPPVDAVDPNNPAWGEQVAALNPERPLCRSNTRPGMAPAFQCPAR